MDSNIKYALVVLSHSSYSDLWPVLIESYAKNFTCSHFDLYITSDDIGDARALRGTDFKLLKYSPCIAWSDALLECVDQLDYEKVIFTFDDLILTGVVNCESMIKLLDENRCNYLKLICSHVKLFDRIIRASNVFRVTKHDSYRGSLVFTALDRELIASMLASEELRGLSPWGYEREVNSILSNKFTFCGVRKNIFKFENLVIKGGINYIALVKLRILSRLEYQGHREVLSAPVTFIYYLKLIIFTLVKYVTPSICFYYLRKIKHKMGNVS